ncbi:hypothetical protein GDO81_027939 [Engystomops pustulosus]|uniref:Peptidase S1 domain-containing protein n=1 Tax=Engystomops pustulosus TaxID=76066 RepID=A0AAV6Z0L2_ENGPU|nr:hypothetical protein GDO81_027939 [Engystomops pustulosus]
MCRFPAQVPGVHLLLPGASCGFLDIDTSGSVSPGPWPWQVDLWKDDRRACGGALISANWVITAAQCFIGPDSSDSPSDWSVTTASGTQAMRQFAVQKISIHGSFITPEQGNNVALVRLLTPAPLGPYTEPICLPQSSHKIPYNSSCWFSGNNDDPSDSQMKPSRGVKMDLVGPNECNCIYSHPNSQHSNVSILPGMICATRPEAMGDLCLRDFGGPLACKENRTWFLIGVQSFGGGCDTLLPEVFTDLAQYEKWISRETRDAAFRSQLDTQPTALDTDRCSFTSPRACGRSVTSPGPGADDVTDKTWPWQVSLQLYGSHVCSGVLIAETWFLIAAHCIPRYTTISDYTVSLSRQLQNRPNPREVTRKIKRVVVNPGYTSKNGKDDLALVEMFYGITFSDYILPICLPRDPALSPPTRCWVSGWGQLYPSDSSSSSSPRLRDLEVSLLDAKNCGAQGNSTENRGQLCAGAKQDNTFSCLMDSSAPLVCQPKPGGPWFLYGMTSQSSPPKMNSCPGNFTPVAPSLSWILEVVPIKDLRYLDSNKTERNDSDHTTQVNVTTETDGSCPGAHTQEGVTCAEHSTIQPPQDGSQQTNTTGISRAETLWWNRSTHGLLLLLVLGLCC